MMMVTFHSNLDEQNNNNNKIYTFTYRPIDYTTSYA